MSSYFVSLMIAERDRLDAAILALRGGSLPVPSKRRGRPPAIKQVQSFDYDATNVPEWVKPVAKKSAPPKKKGGMSVAGRKAIGDAARARWARVKAEKAEAVAPKKKTKAAIIAEAIAPVEDAEFKNKMSIAMKAAWAKRKKAAKKTPRK
jgi:hypothetical protein